jgi:homoaconitase/3-isopropylmalate dehydratase large subunit
MTIAEKILAMHDTRRRGFVKQGDTVLLDVDWIMASEIAWKVG